jgi:O-antigen/teichoic acid export membrane protein
MNKSFLSHFGGHASVYAAGTSLSALLWIVLLSLYARLIPPAEYGILELAVTLATFLGSLMVTGSDAAQSYYFFSPDGEDQRGKPDLLVTRLVLITMFGAVLFGTAWLAARLSSDLQRLLPVPLTLLGYAFLAKYARQLMEGNVQIFRLLMQPSRSVTVSVLFLATSGGISLWALTTRGAGIEALLWGETIGAAALFLLSYGLLRGHLRGRFSHRQAGRILRYGLPLLPTVLAEWIIDYSDRWFLAHYFSEKEVGIYAMGVRFSTAALMAVQVFRMTWWPLALSMQDKPEAPYAYRAVGHLYLTLGSIGALLMGALGWPILVLLTSPAYREAYQVMGILPYTFVLYGFYLVSGLGTFLTRRTGRYTLALFASAALNIMLNLLLIPSYGMLGAAVATLGSFAAGNILVYRIGTREHPMRLSLPRMGTLFLITCGGLLLQVHLTDPATGPDFLKTAGVTVLAASVIAYLGFDRGEINILRSVAQAPELPAS